MALTRAAGPSVIHVRVAVPLPEVVGRDIVRVLCMRAEAFEKGCLATIDEVKSRVRLLPIASATREREPE
ncbi:MAG: hypothetical protein ABR538_10355 [Candidatus Binatia bacterium]